MVKIAPSLLAADLLHMQDEIDSAADAGADWLHYDVIDGLFAPNITFGQVLLKAAADYGKLPCDVHLMIEKPERYIEEFAAAGAKVITVHAEATVHLNRTLGRIRSLGCLAGVSLNPSTSPECLRYSVGEFDLALVMTVNPGFGGQKLIPGVVRKIGEINRMLQQAGVSAEIEVDGDVNLTSAQAMIDEGATVLVAGSKFFGAEDRAGFVSAIRQMS